MGQLGLYQNLGWIHFTGYAGFITGGSLGRIRGSLDKWWVLFRGLFVEPHIAQKEIKDQNNFKEKALDELYDTYKNLNENEIWHLMHWLTNKEISTKNKLFFVALRDAALCMLHRDLPKVYQLRPGIYDSVSEKINEQMNSCSQDIQEIFNLYIGIERPKFYAYKSNGEDSNIYMVEYNEQDVPFPICDVATYSENIKFYMNKGEEIAYLYDLDTPNIPLELKNIKLS